MKLLLEVAWFAAVYLRNGVGMLCSVGVRKPHGLNHFSGIFEVVSPSNR